jgi:hypothetical protein
VAVGDGQGGAQQALGAGQQLATAASRTSAATPAVWISVDPEWHVRRDERFRRSRPLPGQDRWRSRRGGGRGSGAGLEPVVLLGPEHPGQADQRRVVGKIRTTSVRRPISRS